MGKLLDEYQGFNNGQTTSQTTNSGSLWNEYEKFKPETQPSIASKIGDKAYRLGASFAKGAVSDFAGSSILGAESFVKNAVSDPGNTAKDLALGLANTAGKLSVGIGSKYLQYSMKPITDIKKATGKPLNRFEQFFSQDDGNFNLLKENKAQKTYSDLVKKGENVDLSLSDSWENKANYFFEKPDAYARKAKKFLNQQGEDYLKYAGVNNQNMTYDEQLIGALGNTLPSLAIALLTKDSKKIAATFSSLEALQNADQVAEQVIANGGTEQEASQKANMNMSADLLTGYVTGVTGLFNPEIKGVIKKAILSSPPQIIEEMLQQINQNKNTGKKWDTGVKETAIMSAIISLLLGGFVGFTEKYDNAIKEKEKLQNKEIENPNISQSPEYIKKNEEINSLLQDLEKSKAEYEKQNSYEVEHIGDENKPQLHVDAVEYPNGKFGATIVFEKSDGNLYEIPFDNKFYNTQKEAVKVGFEKAKQELPDEANKIQEYEDTAFKVQSKTGQGNDVGDTTKTSQTLTTKLLKDIENRDTVKKTYIQQRLVSSDLNLKQAEKDVINNALENEGDVVNVSDFIKKVESELLPLKVEDNKAQYESVTLPSELRGDVKKYKENIYESPVKNSAGDIHFQNRTQNYFGHTRIEDMADGKTRRIIEVQSDLYQKGNLESNTADVVFLDKKIEANKKEVERLLQSTGEYSQTELDGRIKDSQKSIKLLEEQKNGVSKLQQYNDPTAHFRMVREDVKQAADDGKEVVLFPTGETAMKIEGLGEKNNWYGEAHNRNAPKLATDKLEVGKKIYRNGNMSETWIITDVLGDGKFKALPKQIYEDAFQAGGGGLDRIVSSRSDATVRDYLETFDISGKVDTNNPIYKFYEKDLGKYLKQKYSATEFTDENGVTWYKIDIKPEYAGAVEAFKKETQTKAFKDWFGDSKIVDDEGNPLVVYHGTNSNKFDIFDDQKVGSRDSGWYGKGFYFTQSQGEAKSYGTNVMPVFLSIKNPFDFSKYESKAHKGSSYAQTYYLSSIAKDVPIVADNIEIALYDGKKENGNVIGRDVKLKDYIEMVEKENLKSEPVFFEDRNGNKLVSYKYEDNFGNTKYFDTYNTKLIDTEVLKYALFDKKYNTGIDSITELYGVERKIADSIGKEFTKTLKKMGYDGTIQSPYGDEYVAFYPNQIKSADGSNVMFSNDNDNIYFKKNNDNTITNKQAVPKLDAYKKRLGLSFDSYLVDTIYTPNMEKAFGVFSDNTITFAKFVESTTADHEVGHLVFRNLQKIKLFNDFNKQDLLNEVREIKENENKSDYDLEEYIMDKYEEYVLEQENKKTTTFKGKMLEFFEKLTRALKEIFTARKQIKTFYETLYKGQSKEITILTNRGKVKGLVKDGVLSFAQNDDMLASTKNDSFKKIENDISKTEYEKILENKLMSYDASTSFLANEERLFELKMQIQFAKEMIGEHPGRFLIKHVNKDGELNDYNTDRNKNAGYNRMLDKIEGEGIFSENKFGDSVRSFDNYNDRIEVLNEYRQLKNRLVNLQKDLETYKGKVTITQDRVRKLELKRLRENIVNRYIKKTAIGLVKQFIPNTERGDYIVRINNLKTEKSLETLREQVMERYVQLSEQAGLSKEKAKKRMIIGYLRKIYQLNSQMILDVKKTLNIKKPIKSLELNELENIIKELNNRIAFRDLRGINPHIQKEKKEVTYNMVSKMADDTVQETTAQKIIQKAKDITSDFSPKKFELIQETLRKHYPELLARMRKYTRNIEVTQNKRTGQVKPFVTLMDKLEKKNNKSFLIIKGALNNGAYDIARQEIEKYTKEDLLTPVKEVISEMYNETKKTNTDLKQIENYFPRVADYVKLQKLFGDNEKLASAIVNFEREQGKIITIETAKQLIKNNNIQKYESLVIKNVLIQQIIDKENALGRKITADQAIDILNNFAVKTVSAGFSPLSKARSEKERTIDVIDSAELLSVYARPQDALLSHIKEMTRKIETRKLFGKYSTEDNIGLSLGELELGMLEDGKLTSPQVAEVITALNKFFQKDSYGTLKTISDFLSYDLGMSQITSAIKQISDFAFNVYANNPKYALLGTFKMNKEIKTELLGTQNIIQDIVGEQNQYSKIIRKLSELGGVGVADRFFGKGFAESTYIRLKNEAKNRPELLREELAISLGSDQEADNVISDLKNNKLSDSVYQAIYNVLSDYRVVSRLNKSPVSIDYPIMASLKNYSLLQLNIMKREFSLNISEGIKNKDSKQIAKGISKMMYLMTLLMLLNVSANKIINWILGRDENISDTALISLYSIFGLSKYNVDYSKGNPLELALSTFFVPAPLSIASNLWKNISSDINKGTNKMVKYIPAIGTTIYNRQNN